MNIYEITIKDESGTQTFTKEGACWTDILNQIMDNLVPYEELMSIIMIKRGVVPHEITSGMCET